MTREETPYTRGDLIRNLAALAVEGAFMTLGTTWIALHSSGGMGAAYLFAVLIALLAVGMGMLQVRYYRQDKRRAERQHWLWQYENDD
jgi:hypothetical protein